MLNPRSMVPTSEQGGYRIQSMLGMVLCEQQYSGLCRRVSGHIGWEMMGPGRNRGSRMTRQLLRTVCIYGMHCIQTNKLDNRTLQTTVDLTFTDSIRLPGSCSVLRWAYHPACFPQRLLEGMLPTR